MITGPELFADKQLHTWDGRSAKPAIGHRHPGALDTLLHYSPLSRATTETEAAADPRKQAYQIAMNLLGLGHVSTYDTQEVEGSSTPGRRLGAEGQGGRRRTVDEL